MESERHNTHILSNSSGDEQNNNTKANLELKLSKSKENTQSQDEPPNKKINIKELFKTILERKEINMVNDLEGGDEENEVSEPNSEMIKYIRECNKKDKNISDNLKGWLNKNKNIKEIKTENIEFIPNYNKKEMGTEMSNDNDNLIEQNNDDMIHTNKENIIGDDDDNDNKVENEENKGNNLNENNENSLNKDLSNNDALSGKINDSNFFDSESENKKQIANYEKSNFNFFLIKKSNNSEDSKDINQRNESDDNNKFNSSGDNDVSEDENNINNNNNNKKKKIVRKSNNLNNKTKKKPLYYNKNIDKSKGKKSIESYKKPIKKQFNNNLYEKSKSKSNSKNKYNNNYNNRNRYSYNNRIIRTKENEKNQNAKIKNKGSTEKNIKNRYYNNNSMKKPSNRKDIVVVRNMKTQGNRNKIRTTGNISTKNYRNEKLFDFSSPKNQSIKTRIKREIYIPIPRKCYFTKKNITMTKEQFHLLNKKIQIMKEKNKIFRHKRNDNNKSPILSNNQFLSGINLYDEMNNKNFNDLDYENYNLDLSRSNNNHRTFMNSRDFNNYMNNKLISPNILINRQISKNLNKKNYQQKLTDIPLSPYLINKYNIKKKPLNKSNSSINFYNSSNKKSNKFPTIINNNNPNVLKPNNSNANLANDNINLNFFKTNTIFNFNHKDNAFIPVLKNRHLEGIQSANINNYNNNHLKSIDISSPVSVDYPNKLNIDMKNFQNSKRFHQDDKGYGKHFGSEQDCPICQSMSMKSNYLMKKMNHYHDFIKKRDQNTIKNNKEQFLNELKMPYTKSQKMEANIIREIKQFINHSKKTENNGQNDASLINAYFGM